MNDEFIDISSDRSSSGNNTIEDLEERDIDGLPELPPSLCPAGYYNPETRLQALTIMESHVPHHQITALTKICTLQLYKIRNKAIKRGYNPEVSKLLLDSYVADKPKAGRPPVSLNIITLIEEILVQNSTTRSFSCGHIAAEVATKLGVEKAVCAKTVYKVLKAKKYKSCKQTTKPGLTQAIKDARWQ